MASAHVFTLIVVLATATHAVAQRPSMAAYKAMNAASAEGKAAAAADESKMAAVNKVINLLADLQRKVNAEGEAEARTYQEVCRMCQTSKGEKSSAIKEGEDTTNQLTASIRKLNTQKDGLDKAIQENVQGIKASDKSIAGLKSAHAKDQATYGVNRADMSAAVKSLSDAIMVTKSGKSASFLQVQSVGKDVQQALLLADALGLGDAETQTATSLLLQQDSNGAPGVEMENFKFHSGGIISTLEKLQGDFRKKSQEIDETEVARVANFNMQLESFQNDVKVKTHEMDIVQKVARSEAIEDIGMKSQDLTTETGLLRDNRGFLDAMDTMCKQKAKVYEQRLQTRFAELSALAQAHQIIKDTVATKTASATLRLSQAAVSISLADAVASSDSAMEAIEAEAEEAVGFLQKKAVKNHQPTGDVRHKVLALFKAQAQELNSAALTELARNIDANPFAKIKKLVQELVERLLTQQGEEAGQKGWCDKATSDADQTRGYASEDIADLNARLSSFKALSDKLGNEIDGLGDAIKELNGLVAQASADRAAESKQNAQTGSDAQEGKAAIEAAMDILNQFYGTAHNKAKEVAATEDSLDKFKRTQSNEQARAAVVTDCQNDCSGMTTAETASCEEEKDECIVAGHKKADEATHAEDSKAKVAAMADGEGQDAQADEAYAGASAAAAGIVAMMEVIAGDFARTISQTAQAESDAEKDHLEFLTVSGSSISEKTVAKDQKTKLRDEANEKYGSDDDKLTAKASVLKTSLQELMQLKKVCQPKAQSYENRVAMRDQEMKSLQKGLCLLEKNSADASEC